MTDRILNIMHLNRDFQRREGYDQGGITIAHTLDALPANPHETKLVLHVAIAVCTETDNFNRKTGYTLAATRLEDYITNFIPNQYCASKFLGYGSLEPKCSFEIPYGLRDGSPYLLPPLREKYIIALAAQLYESLHFYNIESSL